jgi:alkanesulfonate monooxygenase SsuD/methylene tetrahydromethanopterin reductase-like flavin-dependent oxidoreductase (luciferase family)
LGLSAYVSVGRSLETALQRVESAERHGYKAIYITHIAGRDSLTTLMAYAARTERVRLGTGVMPIYSRSPVTTAQSFATLDEFSGGRAVMGLGVSHRPTVEHWYDQRIEKPLREMREYVAVVRAIMRGEDPPHGERFGSDFHFMGLEPRAAMPIYIAGLSPGMLRLAGEIADGVMLRLCNPDYVREVVVPAVAEGREKAGKDLDGFEIVAAVPSAITSGPEEARARLRTDLTPYFGLPFYRKMLERSGYGDDIRAYDEHGSEAISERFLGALAAIGSPEEAVAALRRYRDAGVTSPAVSAIARTDFDVTLDNLAGALRG